MRFSDTLLAKNAAWTMGAYALGQFLRLLTNVTLARILAPDLFGIMLLVNSIRTGIDLTLDIGITQSLVQNRNSEDAKFYNTVWTLRLMRGIALSIMCFAISGPVSDFFLIPILSTALPIAGLYFAIVALGTTALPLLQRQMRYVRLNAFEFVQDCITAVVHIVLCYLSPTIWALITAGLISAGSRSLGSYFVSSIRPAFVLDGAYVKQILVFGKWIFISSLIYFVSSNFDRLFFGKTTTLELVGVYSIARSLSELVGTAIERFNSYIVFPLISSSRSLPRAHLRSSLAKKRFALLLLCAFGIATLTVFADWLIALLYDSRYSAAAWMLPILLIGVWFNAVSILNESTFLGVGRPSYGALLNASKLIWLVLALPISYDRFGLQGAIVAIALAELCRYLPCLWAQVRERLFFGGQELFATLFLFATSGVLLWLRLEAGYDAPVVIAFFSR